MQQNKEFYRRKLPHIQPKGGLFFVTYSSYGSIPSSKLAAIKEEYEMLKTQKGKNDEERKRMKIWARKTYIKNIDALLSGNSSGPHYMKKERIAKIVSDSLHFWDNNSIELYCYCIMSNHVHVVFRLLDETETVHEKQLNVVMHSIKRYSAREANKILGRQGEFWMSESYDYLIRHDDELGRIMEYVLDNPVKAGLCKERKDWKWSYVKEEYNEFI